jgi:hypothetical protein
MTTTQRFALSALLTAIAVTIVTFWAVELYPLITRTGPAPGAGGQWVFAFLPMVGLATVLSMSAVGLEMPLLIRDRALRTPLRLVAGAGATVLAALLAFYWVGYMLRALT